MDTHRDFCFFLAEQRLKEIFPSYQPDLTSKFPRPKTTPEILFSIKKTPWSTAATTFTQISEGAAFRHSTLSSLPMLKFTPPGLFIAEMKPDCRISSTCGVSCTSSLI